MAAFDTVCHNNLLSKINRSPLSQATPRWLSSYLRGRQAKTCFRGVKSSSKKVYAGVPQGSKLSPSLFNFYIADMTTPTELVKRVCYADDNIRDMEDRLNINIAEITAYLKDNSLLISASKSSVTLFTPDTHQAKTHPRILIEDSRLHLVQCPNILGVHMDTSLSFKPCNRESIRHKYYPQGFGWYILGTTEINLTNDLQGGCEIDHKLCCTNYRNIQYMQNEALRISTGCRKMSNVEHLHADANMLKVKEHSELLSAQYLARCLEPENDNISITTREPH